MPIYLQAENFEGDVTSTKYYAHVELLSASLDVTNTSESFSAGGTRGGHHATKMGKFIITKLVDNSSPSFFKASVNGETIKVVKIKFTRGGRGDKNDLFTVYELADCLINNYSTETETGKEPVETIALSYAKITYKYTGFAVDGKRVGQQVVTYDLRKGQAN